MNNAGVYYVYIITNPGRTVLYIGMTNYLVRRLEEHYSNRGKKESFAGRYSAYHLIYYEEFQFVYEAIAREKELKGWRREKKMKLILAVNSKMEFLEGDMFGLVDGVNPSFVRRLSSRRRRDRH